MAIGLKLSSTLVLHKEGMSSEPFTFVGLILRAGAVLLVANEVRGLILAGPILYAMYEAGGSLMAIWIGFCSLAGIALSIIVPMFIAKKARLRVAVFRQA